jgi:hypothetical protein
MEKKSSTMSNHALRRFFLIVLLVLALSPPAFADANVKPRPIAAVHRASTAVVLFGSWNIGGFSSGGGRTRVVQICVVVMCIALFIMMRKLNG